MLPPYVLLPVSYVSEWISDKSKGRVSLGKLDWLTPPVLHLAGGTYYFSDEKARRMIGYKPVYDTKESMLLTVAYYRPERKDEIETALWGRGQCLGTTAAS